MDVQLDPVAVERAERSLDEGINLRSRAKERANELEAMWAESERKHREKTRRESLPFPLRTPHKLPVRYIGRCKLEGGTGY